MVHLDVVMVLESFDTVQCEGDFGDSPGGNTTQGVGVVAFHIPVMRPDIALLFHYLVYFMLGYSFHVLIFQILIFQNTKHGKIRNDVLNKSIHFQTNNLFSSSMFIVND